MSNAALQKKRGQKGDDKRARPPSPKMPVGEPPELPPAKIQGAELSPPSPKMPVGEPPELPPAKIQGADLSPHDQRIERILLDILESRSIDAAALDVLRQAGYTPEKIRSEIERLRKVSALKRVALSRDQFQTVQAELSRARAELAEVRPALVEKISAAKTELKRFAGNNEGRAARAQGRRAEVQAQLDSLERRVRELQIKLRQAEEARRDLCNTALLPPPLRLELELLAPTCEADDPGFKRKNLMAAAAACRETLRLNWSPKGTSEHERLSLIVGSHQSAKLCPPDLLEKVRTGYVGCGLADSLTREGWEAFMVSQRDRLGALERELEAVTANETLTQRELVLNYHVSQL